MTISVTNVNLIIINDYITVTSNNLIIINDYISN